MINSFAEFYVFYLNEHRHPICRALHYAGSWAVLIVMGYAFYRQQMLWLLLCPIIGYGAAWIGHFVFEKNRPATFKYPLYSLMGDWRMWWDISCGRIPLRPKP